MGSHSATLFVSLSSVNTRILKKPAMATVAKKFGKLSKPASKQSGKAGAVQAVVAPAPVKAKAKGKAKRAATAVAPPVTSAAVTRPTPRKRTAASHHAPLTKARVTRSTKDAPTSEPSARPGRALRRGKSQRLVAPPEPTPVAARGAARPPKRRKTKKRAAPQTTSAKTLTQAAAKPRLPPKAKPQTGTALKATKKRAPTDLADQYTESAKKPRRKKPPAAKLARARRSSEERARVQQLMDPSDDFMRRLARIGAISTTLAGADDAADADATPRRSRMHAGKVQRRPRRWELPCGKCGHKGQFTTAAGVCPRCGAITVRV